MKIAPAQVERFLRQPDPGTAAILVYGADEGLVRERVERLIQGALDDPNDPFSLAEFTGDTVRADPARLADEARSLTLTGGRRVVRVRQANDGTTAACRNALGLGAIDALIIVESGELGTGSSLRRLFETTPNAAAIACYRDQGRELAALIEHILAEHGLELEPDARAYLVEHLGADRGVTRSELDKLVLYLAGPDAPPPPGRRRVRLEDVAAVVGDSAALGLDDLVDAVTVSDLVQVERCLERLLREGQSPVRIVRALANHFVRLQRMALQVERGEDLVRVVEQARPPIHFRRKKKVHTSLRRWSAAALERALVHLLEAEVGCKTTGWPAALICREAALTLGRAAGRS